MKYAIGAALTIIVLLGSYKLGYESAETKWELLWSEQSKAQSDAKAEAEKAMRDRETYWQDKLKEVDQNAQATIVSLQASVISANASSDQLREQTKRLAKRASRTCTSATVNADSKAAESAAMVLADVLGRIDKRAGELAEAYDRARVAGLACEQSYEALKF